MQQDGSIIVRHQVCFLFNFTPQRPRPDTGVEICLHFLFLCVTDSGVALLHFAADRIEGLTLSSQSDSHHDLLFPKPF